MSEFTKTDSYDCGECLSFCCSYPVIQVRPFDQKRLAEGLGITEKQVEEEHCYWANNAKLCLKHAPDYTLGTTSCKFLDKDTRACTIHDIRPKVCRQFPSEGKCKWWDDWTAKGRKVHLMKRLPGLAVVG